MFSLLLVVRNDRDAKNTDIVEMNVGNFKSVKAAKKFGTILRMMASVLKVRL